MVNDGCANPPGTLYFQAEIKGRKTGVRINGAELGGKMCLVELPLPQGGGDEAVLSLYLDIGKKRRPVRFAADVRSREAPFTLTIRLKH